MVRIRKATDLYKAVYEYLILGKHQAEISRILGYDKARISRITKTLVKAGYLLCIDPNSRVKFYEATKKKFVLNDILAFSKALPNNLQRSRHRCNIMRISKARFKTNVIGHFGKIIKWDKGPIKINNNVVYYDYDYPFANLGSVKFRFFENNKSLIIILPQVLWEKSAGKPDNYLKDMANKCAYWFMKKFNVDLQGLEIVQKPHIGVAAKEADLIHAAQEASYNINGIMLDTSAPDYAADVESENFEDVINYLDAIKKIRILEMKVNTFENSISLLTDKIDHLVDLIENPPSIPFTFDSLKSYG